MTCMTIVYHMVSVRPDGKVVVSRIGKVCWYGIVVSTKTYSVTMTPSEARQMAKAMRDSYGHFLKEDIDSVEVLCEPYETYQITWANRNRAEVEDIRCRESDGDGWSWEFAQAIDEAASEAEAGE